MVMSSFSKVLFLFTLTISVSGLATPHVLRSPHGHHALAARMANPAPSPAVGPYGREVKVVKPKRKRGDTGRCRAQTQTSSAAPSSSSSEAPQPTSSVQPVAAVAASPSSSSEAPAPPPPETSSSTPAPPPEPTTSEAPAPAPAPAPTTSDSGSSNSGGSNSNLPSFLVGTQTGQGTFYAIGLGACGITNGGDDRIAAVSHELFDQFPGYDGVNPNSNPICGKSVTATYQGKSTTVTITDRCTGCKETDLDFSPRAFQDIADFSVGRLSGMTWVWNN